MTPRQIITSALRRTSKAKRYEQYRTAPSAKPFYALLILLAVLLSGIWVTVQFYHSDVADVECGRVK